MTNEGYRKRLDEWEAQQRELARKKASDESYKESEMRSRIPFGCILSVGALLALVVYLIGTSEGWWKRFLF